MACYKLTSCTVGSSTVLWSDDAGFAPYVGQTITPLLFPTTCFNVELVEEPCECEQNTPGLSPAGVVVCVCNSIYECYKLQDCTNPLGPYIYVTGNLHPYVGQTISVAEFPDHCYTVVGVTDAGECAENTPTPVTCASLCTCNLNCYELTNCLNPLSVIYVNSYSPFALNDVIFPAPAIYYPGGNNCWTVTGINIQPCNPDFGLTITALASYGPGNCELCGGPPTCYKLTSCDGLTVVYTQSDLVAYVGQSIQTTLYPGQCWVVTTLGEGETCDEPVTINPLSITLCVCPCYTLTNCRTNEVIYSNSNLLAYIGLTVHLLEYDGCDGDCWLVASNPPPNPCNNPVQVTVLEACNPCGPCGETCYELVDCQTDVVFVVALNPTVNGVDLSTLIVGQAIGQVDIEGVVTDGCWYVRVAQGCSAAVEISVFNIYQPQNGQTGCEQCLNSCYGLQNCQTLEIDYVIKYTGPNPNGLPNPNTINGVIGDLCFDEPEGCVTGCYIFQLIPGVSCENSVDWSTVVSYNQYDNCDECLPKCYLLTECAPAVTAPFIVSNDLSLYVGNIAKICDSQGECHCYHVELAQTCDGAIVIDNASASFTTCEECNSCGCPDGYTKIDDICQKVTSVPATQEPVFYTAAPGSISNTYGNLGTRFYANASSVPYPITAVTGPDRFVDASSSNLVYTSSVIGVWGGPIASRLNTVGVWTTAAPDPLNEWIGFSQCIEIQESGTYCIGIGGDNDVRIKLDGVLLAQSTIGAFSYNYWHVFEVTINAGTHVIVVEGKNTGGSAAFGAEIYNTDITNLQTLTTAPQLQAVTLFTTFSKRTNDSLFETGENSGYTCPPGYTYENCDGPSCSLIETIPFVECAPTYQVTDCSGVQAPFITNTDLSLYVGGTYKTCITAPTYSTTCYLLKDCNQLVPDIYTTTDLIGSLWGSVSLVGYPGSCFIVLPVLENTVCLPNEVEVDTQTACSCLGAQAPWPDGCYCVTVEEVAFTPAIDFPGVFDATNYGTCEACTQVCYLLTDCQDAVDPVIVCNDLADYVGKIIKIEGCGDICWEVTVADTCENSTKFGGTITSFDTCEDCLPPVPPPAPPYDLHLRRIKPGYNSPNSCYTTDYIENVNCKFAQQVYNAMLIKRYGITMCCEEDLKTWDIKKQLMDLDILKDPTMCKSTLCDCDAPCLIDVVFTLLPYCGDPSIVSVVPSISCVAPVLTSVVLDVPPVPAECFCFTVETLQQNVTITYLDCCCKPVTTVITEIGTQSFCAATAPVSPATPAAIVVTNAGACDTAGACNPPTCYCWKVTNQNPPPAPPFFSSVILGVTFDACTPLGDVVTAVGPGDTIYGCSYNPPVIVGPNALVENTGECGAYCGPTPPACVCYLIHSSEACDYTYTDCNGDPQSVTSTPGDFYVCSQTLPIASGTCAPDTVISATAYPCNGGVCGPPPPCVCYEVTVLSLDGQGCSVTYTPCGEAPVTEVLPDGLNYVCSEVPPVNSAGSQCTVTVQSTPLDCGLGECGPPL